jgi:hypothetical protein
VNVELSEFGVGLDLTISKHSPFKIQHLTLRKMRRDERSTISQSLGAPRENSLAR